MNNLVGKIVNMLSTITIKGMLKIAIPFMVIGFVLNSWIEFPLFVFLSTLLLAINILACISCRRFFEVIKSICTELNYNDDINSFYYKYTQSKICFIFMPLLIILIFGFGVCNIFGAFKFTITFLWLLVLFVSTVWVSIVGYTQYFVLIIFIIKLSEYNFENSNFNKTTLPANLSWLQEITKLYHFYRSMFFLLGSLYIFGYSMFALCPIMEVDMKSMVYWILWFLIFTLIVCAFPILSLVGYKCIKKIVQAIKLKYTKDYYNESQLNATNAANSYLKNVIDLFYVNTIDQSSDYPLKDAISTLWGFTISTVNFFGVCFSIYLGFKLS